MKTNKYITDAEFSSLFDVYKHQVYAYVNALVKSPDISKELTQDIFIKLWTIRESLNEVRNLDGYIYILCKNTALNHLKKIRNNQLMMESLKKIIIDGHRELEDQLTYKDYKNMVDEVVSKLSPQRKKIYLMSREEGLSINEIAEKLGLSANTVKNHLVTSLSIIREYLQTKGGILAILISFVFFI